MARPTIRLRDMTDAEYDAYFERLIPHYAEEGARATGMAPDEALAFARKQIEGMLPEGRRTPMFNFKILLSPSIEEVGILWYGVRTDMDPPQVFIYDIDLDEKHRGLGLGSAALLTLEEEARRHGVDWIGLHVFKTNEGAIRLCERLGYEAAHRGEGGVRMAKRL